MAINYVVSPQLIPPRVVRLLLPFSIVGLVLERVLSLPHLWLLVRVETWVHDESWFVLAGEFL
jgi:hypothetical protein